MRSALNTFTTCSPPNTLTPATQYAHQATASYSALDKLSEYKYFYISNDITLYTFLVVFKIDQSLPFTLQQYQANTLYYNPLPSRSLLTLLHANITY